MKWIDDSKALGEEQSGFRKISGGLANILILREIIEKKKNQNQELYLTFIDIEKAYDTVDRRKLFTLLEHIGVDSRVVQVVKALYKENNVKFTLGDISTKWIKNNVGVRQGCSIAAFLSSTRGIVFRRTSWGRLGPNLWPPQKHFFLTWCRNIIIWLANFPKNFIKSKT